MRNKKYRIKPEYDANGLMATKGGIIIRGLYIYHVQMSGIIGWVTIKSFIEEDVAYACKRAHELLDLLNENL